MFKFRPVFKFTAAVVIGASALLGSAAHAANATAIFAGGCFWCTESDFEKVPGVIEAVSGYMGVVGVNYPGRPATTILAGGSGV